MPIYHASKVTTKTPRHANQRDQEDQINPKPLTSNVFGEVKEHQDQPLHA